MQKLQATTYHSVIAIKYQRYNEMKQCKSDFKFKFFFKGRLYISELELSYVTDIKMKSILCKSPASKSINYVQEKKIGKNLYCPRFRNPEFKFNAILSNQLNIY